MIMTIETRYPPKAEILTTWLSVAIVALSLLWAPAALARTFIVSNNHDDGPGSLREAVSLANATPGPALIQFSNGIGEIVLSSGHIEVTDDLTIQGPAQRQVISGGNSSRIFAATSADRLLRLERLTLTNGRTGLGFIDSECATGGKGGAVCAEGDLELFESVLTTNSTEFVNAGGGAIAVLQGSLSVVNSTIANNWTEGTQSYGGGILVDWTDDDGRQVTILNSANSGNQTFSTDADGGLWSYAAQTSIHNSVFEHNQVHEANGGGLTLFGESNVTNSTIANNATLGIQTNGGGIYVPFRARLRLANSTVSDNQAEQYGGGVYIEDGQDMSVFNSSIVGNSAGGEGAGLAYVGRTDVGWTTISLASSILAGNGDVGDNL